MTEREEAVVEALRRALPWLKSEQKTEEQLDELFGNTRRDLSVKPVVVAADAALALYDTPHDSSPSQPEGARDGRIVQTIAGEWIRIPAESQVVEQLRLKLLQAEAELAALRAATQEKCAVCYAQRELWMRCNSCGVADKVSSLRAAQPGQGQEKPITLSAVVRENGRLQARIEVLEEALTGARDTLTEVLLRAPGYDWNSDPRHLTLMTGGTFSKIKRALAPPSLSADTGREEPVRHKFEVVGYVDNRDGMARAAGGCGKCGEGREAAIHAEPAPQPKTATPEPHHADCKCADCGYGL